MLLLDRPPVNAYDYAFLRELDAGLDEVRLDESVNGLVVASASARFFSAGTDLEWFAASSQRVRTMTCLLAQEVFLKLERLPIPTVAAIAGSCLGGGLELALACCQRVAADGGYRLGLPEVDVGLLPGSGGTQRLPRVIGVPGALDLILTGRSIAPPEAFAMGLVDKLVPDPGACLDEALSLASSGRPGRALESI